MADRLPDGGELRARASALGARRAERRGGARAELLGRVDARDTATARAARVAFTTAAPGVHRAGVVHRLDGVPVPFRAPLASSRPGDDELLAALAGRLAAAREAVA